MASRNIYINGDIVALICKELRERPLMATLSNVSQVSKLWHDIAVSQLYSGLAFHFRPKNMFWSKRVLEVLESNARARLALRWLTMKRGPYYPSRESSDCVISHDILKRLSVIIPLCPNLEQVIWSLGNPFPDNVIQSLNTCPRLKRLHLLAPSLGPDKDSVVNLTRGIPAKHKITSLQVIIGGLYEKIPDDFLEQFNSSAAPEVHKLIVDLTQLESLDLSINDWYKSIPFSAIAPKKFPSITQLTLRSWSFVNDGKTSIQHHLKFAALRRLTITFGSDIGNTAHREQVDRFFTSLRAHNTQLEELCVNVIGRNVENSELRNFLASQESLKFLQLGGYQIPTSVLLDYLTRNLRTLTGLSWVMDTPEFGKRVRFSPAELEIVRDSCPDLDLLHVFLPLEDLDVSTSAIIPVLKSFPKLVSLRIHAFYETTAGTEGYPYQDHMMVEVLAKALQGSSMKHFGIALWDLQSRIKFTEKDANGRRWAVTYDNSLSSPGIRIVDRAEKKFEKWMKRHCRALGKKYVPPKTRGEKRQGWVKAMEWFENYQGDEISKSKDEGGMGLD